MTSRVSITNRIPVGTCMHSGSVWIILKPRNFFKYVLVTAKQVLASAIPAEF